MYLNDVTVISLFHRLTFRQKLNAIPQPKVKAALLAAMFSIAVRYTTPPPEYSEENIHNMACQIATDALAVYGDEPPCVSLTQAWVLISFYQLITGVRGRAWRTLGQTIRCAIEMQCNIIDAADEWPPRSVKEWVLNEERRRIWWTLWEFDVFAGTIRRAPNSMDWKHCKTYLPVSDETWFNEIPQKSCFLKKDPAARWRDLRDTGNRSGFAWFIVINSYMREANLLTETNLGPPSAQSNYMLEVIENVASCFSMALPSELSVESHPLIFDSNPSKWLERAEDGWRYSVYIMRELTSIMIYRNICLSWPGRMRFKEIMEEKSKYAIGEAQHYLSIEAGNGGSVDSLHNAWYHYLRAADRLAALLRLVPPHHVKTTNPFFANTLWIAAAILLTCKAFTKVPNQADAVKAKADLVRLHLEGYISFWKSSSSLLQQLDLIEVGLEKSAHLSDFVCATPNIRSPRENLQAAVGAAAADDRDHAEDSLLDIQMLSHPGTMDTAGSHDEGAIPSFQDVPFLFGQPRSEQMLDPLNDSTLNFYKFFHSAGFGSIPAVNIST